jgi:hypothetical protein
MGLDISFNRKEAIEAGMETSAMRNGSDASIQLAEEDEANGMPNQDGYLEWLYEVQQVIRVPGMEHWVNDEGLDTCIVRANKWGRTYKPLTEWLTYNAIEWSEF